MTVSCSWIPGMRNCPPEPHTIYTRVVTGDCLLVPWKHISTLTVPEPLQIHTFLWSREAAFYEPSSAIETSLLSRSVSCRPDLSWGPLEFPSCRKWCPPLTSDACQLRVNFSLRPWHLTPWSQMSEKSRSLYTLWTKLHVIELSGELLL